MTKAAPAFYSLPWQVGRALGARTASGYSLASLPRHYSGWVYAAVRAIAQGCSACEVRFTAIRQGRQARQGRQGTTDDKAGGSGRVVPQSPGRLGALGGLGVLGGDPVPLPAEHPLVRLFSEVNPFHTYRELVEITLTDLEVTGNAFWLMSRGRISGVPVEIWPVPPSWMRVVPGDDEYVREYRLRRSGRETRLEARDVVHFRYPNPVSPGNTWWGYAPLEAALEAVMADESIARAQRRSFENGPLPGALLRTQNPLSKEQQERFRALFESAHVGPDAAGRLLITDGEAEITPFTRTPREMDFVDSARSVRDRILGVFGVPPAVLGIVEDFNRANAQAALDIFARQTLAAKLAMIAQRVTQDICTQFLPSGLACEFASPVPADRDADRRDRELELKALEVGVRLGVLSANEARADFYGKAAVSLTSDGDEYSRPKPVAGAKIDVTQLIGEKDDGKRP